MRLAVVAVILCMLSAVPSVSAGDVSADVAVDGACLETSSSGSARVSVSGCQEAVTGTVEWVGHFLSP